MVDGLKIVVGFEHTNKFDTSCLNKYGLSQYCLRDQYKKGVDVRLKLRSIKKGLSIEGSLPYSINGNSFEAIGPADIKGFIDWLSEKINVDVFKGHVIYFEAGGTVETPFKYNLFANHHVGVPGMELCNQRRKQYKVYTDYKDRTVKFYNAGKNLNSRKIFPDVRARLKAQGIFNPDKNYVKFEVKYLKPAFMFSVPVFTPAIFLDEKVMQAVAADVLNTYTKVNQTGYTLNKLIGKPSSIDITLMALQALAQKCEVDVESLLLNTIDEIDRSFLNNHDKSRRREILRPALRKIKVEAGIADIKELLAQRLETSCTI